MYDSSIRPETLLAELARYDRRVYKELITEAGVAEAVSSALTIAHGGFAGLTLDVYRVKKKIAYHVSDLPHNLLLRKLNRNLRIATLVKQSDRDTIVKRLVSLLEEGVQHRVYKFDIKNFFETLPHAHLRSLIGQDRRITRHSERLISDFLARCDALALPGVPRGVALSATLAEISLLEFDKHTRARPDVYFYARYVDDILVMTNGHEDAEAFRRDIESHLPHGVQFNPRKSQHSWFVEKGPGSTPPVKQGTFDFLGYQISYYSSQRQNNRVARMVDVDLSTKKVKRIKTRLVRSALAYIDERNVGDLEQRIRILSGNYNIIEFDTKKIRNVGLYCNYRRVAPSSGTLKFIDTFYRQLITGNAGPVSQRLAAALTDGNKASLLKYSFAHSFSKRTFYAIPFDDLARLTACWSYV